MMLVLQVCFKGLCFDGVNEYGQNRMDHDT